MNIGLCDAFGFRVDGEPQPFPKKLSSKKSAKIFYRDPLGVKRGWMEEIARVAREKMQEREFIPKGIPVVLRLDFYRSKPDSARKRTFPVTVPDCDNLAYSVMNSLKGIVYHDDSQVITQTVTKYYADENNAPGVVIHVAKAEIAD